ncbi:MAG: fatty acid desaturase family protein [Holosporales bacterium]|jgi:linoleoyl-CoA desaturase
MISHRDIYQRAENDIRQTVKDTFQKRNLSRYGNGEQVFKAFILFALMIAGYYGAVFSDAPVILRLSCFIVMGLANLLLIFNVSHDAAHHALSPYKRLNNIIHFVVFTLFGINAQMWQWRHLYAHHPFTNINGSDPDIDANTILRLSPNHPFKPHFRWQHWYAPFVYMLAISHSIFWQDFQHLAKRQYGRKTNVQLSATGLLLFWIAKVFYIGVMLVLPMLLSGLSVTAVLLGYAIMQAVVSLTFVLLLAVNHFSHRSAYPQNAEQIGFFAHQLHTNVDWYASSRTICFIFGGANAHLAHHLFMGISHRHYYWITRVIKEKCAMYGLPYHEVSLWGCVRSHFLFLRLLATQQDDVLHNNLPLMGNT